MVTGTVTDAASGKPIPDVVITATSPAQQGEEIVVTDSAGLYRLSQLAPGIYSLRLEKETYKPYTRPDVTVRVDRTVRVNILLQPEALTETLVITSRPPTVDIGSATTGLTVGKDFIKNIAFVQPNGSGVRNFDSLAAVAPQVVTDQFGVGFSGAQSPENLYMVDGISVSDPAFGTNGAQFPLDFVEEGNVMTGGYMAEYGRATGGVLNIVTKSGSNEFHGSVWGNWTPGLLSAQAPTIKSDASAFGRYNKLWNTVDFGAEVGGPILKDRLWFYVGFSPSFSRTKRTRTTSRFLIDACGTGATGCTDDPARHSNPNETFQFDDDGFIKTEEIPSLERSMFVDTRAFSYIGKLTLLINADHNISVSVIGSPASNTNPGTLIPRSQAGATQATNSTSVSLKYAGSFLDKHLLADATVGYFRLDASTLPLDGSKIGQTAGDGSAAGTPAVIFRRTVPHTLADFEDLPSEVASLCEAANLRPRNIVNVRGVDRYVSACPVTGAGATYVVGGPGFFTTTGIDRIQGRASLTYMMQALGHHTWKAGIDIERMQYDIRKAYSGGVLLQESTSGNTFSDVRQFGYYVGPDKAVQQNVLHNAPVSVGVGAYLQDSWAIMDVVTLNAGLRYETQQMFAGDGTLGLTLNNMLSPRVGLIYDVTQQGRSKLFANYARYYEAVPMDIADRALTGENQFQFIRDRAANANRQGCFDQGTAVGTPVPPNSQASAQCMDTANYRQINRTAGGIYDVNGAGLKTGQGKTAVDPDLQPQSTDEFVVGGEYEIIADGRLGVSYTHRYMNRVVEDMSLDEANTYFLGNPGFGMATAFPKAVRDYDAVTAYFTKSFGDGWMANASYTWSYLRGNYNGLFRPETGQIDPNINSDFDLVSLLRNRTGPLDADRTHFIKAYAAKEFVVGNSLAFTIGLSYEGLSGLPINYFAAHAIYLQRESFVLPRGSGGRTPWQHSINAKLNVSYRIAKNNVISFSTDVFNMFNFQAVTAVDDTFSTAEILPVVVPPGTNPQSAICIAGNDPKCYQNSGLYGPDGSQVTPDVLNSNFKRATAYQQPISVRFGLKFSF